MKLITVEWEGLKILKIKNDAASICVNKYILDWLGTIDIKGKNVIDGGANVGTYAMVFSGMVGEKGMVYGFEIQTEIYKIAEQNIVLNKRKNIRFYNKALSNVSCETVGFTYIDYYGESPSSVGIKTEKSLSGQPHCGEIETIAIDDLKMDNVGLIKLDLEGHEPQALKGMWNTIEICKPHLLIELSPGYLVGKEHEVVQNIVSKGYSVNELSDYNYTFSPL